MLLFCGLAYIYSGFLLLWGKYAHWRLVARMRSVGRLMSWDEFAPKLAAPAGTLIRDFTISGWPGGYDRLWWTTDDIYARCPFPWADCEDAVEHPEFWDAPDWCRREYTGVDGAAVLVEVSREQWYFLWAVVRAEKKRPRLVPRHLMNWVDLRDITFMPRRNQEAEERARRRPPLSG